MATLTYFTRQKREKATAKRKKAMIQVLCRFRSTGIDQKASSTVNVFPEHWSEAKQSVKNIAEATYKDEANTTLDKLKKYILGEFSKTNGLIETGWLVSTIDNFFNPGKGKEEPKTLFSFIQDFIDKAPERVSPKTQRPVSYKMRREYERTFYYLQEFARLNRKKLDFEDITLDFYHDFVQYLQSEKTTTNKKGQKIKEPGLAQNTVGKKIQTIKIFLNAATDMGINQYRHFKSHRFAALSEETDHIYLNESELQVVMNTDLPQELDRIRDLFIIGCWTGLRFGDWNQITKANISNGMIHIKQSKTRNKVIIPLHPTVQRIIDKYEGSLPRVPTNQHINRSLKDIAELAKLNERVQTTITKGGIERTTTHNKWELVSTHTARRSFATNMYLMGVPTITIMAITGHKTETAFLKYIRVTPEEHANKIMEFWNRNAMKVVNQ